LVTAALAGTPFGAGRRAEDAVFFEIFRGVWRRAPRGASRLAGRRAGFRRRLAAALRGRGRAARRDRAGFGRRLLGAAFRFDAGPRFFAAMIVSFPSG
jgi:hypothetical protein